MSRLANQFGWVLAVALAAGCGAETQQEQIGQSAPAPLTIGSSDAADTACNVVLRDAFRPAGGQGGYEIDWSTGAGWYVWQGTIDVSAETAAQAAGVGLLFKPSYGSGDVWYEVAATPVEGAPGGFARYQFRITENTVRDGMSTSALMNTRFELAPFVRSNEGGRLFDHNRNADPFTNYVLDSNNGWSVREDATVCQARRPARAVVGFDGGWNSSQHGALVAGGQLVVDYDLNRLPDCRNTHNGYPAWNTIAYVRFSPGGELFEGSVRGFLTNYGQPTNDAVPVPFEVKIPANATSAELWFKNFSGAGSSCVTWDSNLNQNYRFEVRPQPPAEVLWAGNWGNGFNRECQRVPGLSEPVSIDSWIAQRACMFVDAEVYVPALTDATERPELIAAQVEYSVDGGEARTAWLEYVGRTGNNYRYRWALPREEMTRSAWSAYDFSFRFSTDGIRWFRIGQGDGPDGGAARNIVSAQ